MAMTERNGNQMSATSEWLAVARITDDPDRF
jgi:hypothetical protein